MTGHRSGFALIELLVAIALLAIVGGAISEGLRRQQQVFRSIALMVAARGDVRDAAEVLAADLSAASPLDTLPLARDSAVEFLSAIGASVSCDSAPGYTLRLPPEELAGGLLLTSLLATPDSGDILLVYNDDSAATAGEPRWDRHTITAVSSKPAATACPASTGFTTAGDATEPAYIVTLRSAASNGLNRGAPVRILRRGRYSLYRSSNSRWYLGNRRCNALGPSVCGVIQPLSGPYAGYSSTGQSGIAYRYFDAAGASLSSLDAPTRVARVDIAVRARSSMPIQLGGLRPTQYMDSTSISIALRNRD
ncbi:MAG: prepilin-type N-terminal cleavage/methylation domain-containing protein [Gemmatimonadaceae bacterium]|nr:prepilin-type N-terminal cleavage/methylation domain-containing protein [Gemmatimonadaceae bacterium]